MILSPYTLVLTIFLARSTSIHFTFNPLHLVPTEGVLPLEATDSLDYIFLNPIHAIFKFYKYHSMNPDTNLEEIFYPPKPDNIIERSNQNKLGISLILYIVSFYWLSGKNIQSVLIFAVCLLVHELGHFIAMRVFNYQDTKIFFVPFLGALTVGTKEEVSQKQQLIILLAGPVPGIFMGFVLYYLGAYYANALLSKSGLVFMIVNLLNLLPIYPLDGGRIVDTLYFGKNKIISKAFVMVSIAVLTYISFKQEDYFLLILPAFILLQFIGQIDVDKIKARAEHQEIRTNIRYEELSDKEYWLLRDLIGVSSRPFFKIITPTVYEVAEQEAKVISFIQLILRKPITLDLSRTGRILFMAIWLVFLILPILFAINTLKVFNSYF